MSFRVRGIRDTSNLLHGIAARANDLRPIWPAVGDEIAQAMAMQFATNGSFGGRPWAPLSPPYLAWKVAHGYPAATLVRTGAMRTGFTSRPMGHEVHRPKSADFGPGVDYYRYHHTGTSKMPARPVLFRSTALLARYRPKIADYIATGRTG